MVQISAVMIARNEQDVIVRALSSIRPYVDDMIVLDTGSDDKTVVLAKQTGARVFHFPWCDDFSKARNQALDQSDAQWNFIMDADEYLVEGGAALRSAVHDSPDFVGAVAMVSAYGQDETSHSVRNWLTRLLPAGIRYQGRIHEQPIHRLPVKHITTTLHHDGYRPELQKRKNGRNEALLKAEIECFPNDAYLHYQLGKESEVKDDFEHALVSYRTAIARLASQNEEWQHDLAIRSLFCMKKTGAFDEALNLALQWQNRLQSLPDYHFVLGDLYLDMALTRPAEADTLLPLIEAHWLRCLEIGERPEMDGCVTGRGSTLAAHNLSVFYESLGLMEQAARYKNFPSLE